MFARFISRPKYVLWISIIVVIVGGVGGLWLARTLPSQRNVLIHDSPGFLFPVPHSLTDLVRSADLIVIGTVGPIVNEGVFEGYDRDGNLIQPDNFDVNNLSIHDTALPFVDYIIDVQEILKGNGTSALDKPIILRMPGKRTGEIVVSAEYPMSVSGDHHIFFLSQNPDGQSYGLYYGARSRLVVDERIVTYSDGRRTPVTFDGRTFSPDDFVLEVLEVIQKESE